MQVDAQIRDGTSTEDEPFRLKDAIVQTVTMWMRWIGVKRVELTTPFKTVPSFTRLTWKSFVPDDDIPQSLKLLRPYILLNVVQGLLERFNLSHVEITLSEGELKQLSFYWGYISGNIPDIRKVAADNPVKLPLDMEALVEIGD